MSNHPEGEPPDVPERAFEALRIPSAELERIQGDVDAMLETLEEMIEFGEDETLTFPITPSSVALAERSGWNRAEFLQIVGMVAERFDIPAELILAHDEEGPTLLAETGQRKLYIQRAANEVGRDIYVEIVRLAE
jgi:hypothetical protein